MNEDYNNVQYVIPKDSEIFFSILPHTRNVYIVLLDGIAELHVKNREIRLPLCQEFPIPVWECLWPHLTAKTACNFLVHGCHYVFPPIQTRLTENTCFNVFPSGNSFSFVLEKDVHLQIFPVQYTDQHSHVTIKSSRGAPEVSGFKLSSDVTYSLTPYSPVLVKSSDGEPYSIYVHGLERRIRLSSLDENCNAHMKSVQDHIFHHCLFAKKFKHISPTILVLGPKNVGKTSFCHLLANGALVMRRSPVYVDLNIQRGFSIPGSLSLTVIEGRADSTLEFKYYSQKLLHFGSVVFHTINIPIYYNLVRKMGGMLAFHQKYSDKKNSLAVIDTDGSQGDNVEFIECILQSFAVDLVVAMGDKEYYEKLKHSVLKAVPSEFIPKPRNCEPQNDYYEARYYQYWIQKYFCSSIERPVRRKVRTIGMDCITIYRIVSSANVQNSNDETTDDLIIEPMVCSSNMINRLLAVSAAKRVELHAITEVKYYVCFTEIDVSAKTVSVLAPGSENFNGGILLMGYVLRLKTHKDVIIDE